MPLCMQVLIFFSLLVCLEGQKVETSSPSSLRGCVSMKIIGETAGMGFDNLRNMEMERVVDTNYSLCKTTEDGLFLIPDAVTVQPVKRSNIQTSISYFENFDSFTSVKSRSINFGGGFKGISGKFSLEYETMKSRQVFDKTETVRMQFRHSRYTARLASRAPLNPAFKKRVERIASFLLENATERANYETQLLVRDYGTHVITRVELGATLIRTDQIEEKGSRSVLKDKKSLSLAVGFVFKQVLDLSISYDESTVKENVKQYRDVLKSTEIYSLGGAIVSLADKNLGDTWSRTVDSNMVALDVAGDPIHFFINEDTMPELPYSTLVEVQQLVRTEGVENYYDHNVIEGCTDVASKNFVFQANVNDGSCNANTDNISFGGVFQTCDSQGPVDVCNDIKYTNPLTGDFSCPSKFTKTIINRGTKSKTTSRRIERRCGFLWLFSCFDVTEYVSTANYEAFWCYSRQNNTKDNLLFGGLFTPYFANVWTSSKTCPPWFYEVKLLDFLTICLSQNVKSAKRYSLPFGGFYSCREGNPLAPADDHISKRGCPDGFSHHLAYIDSGCKIYYCVKSNSSPKKLPKIQRPPYMDIPSDASIHQKTYKIGITKDGDIVDLDDYEVTNAAQAQEELNETQAKALGISNQINTRMLLVLLIVYIKVYI